MTAIAANMARLTPFAGLAPRRGTFPIKANVWIKKGAQVGLDSAGRCMPADTLANGCLMVLGKASAEYNNQTGSELGGGAGATDVEVEYGVFGWENSGSSDEIADDDVGKPCYAVDDQTVALTSQSGTLPVAGVVSEVGEGGKVYVYQGPAGFALASSYAGAAAGVALQSREVTIGHADLTDADSQQDINIGAVLPANAHILGVSIALATPFTGGGTGSATVDIGTAGDPDALVDGANIFDAAVDGQASTRPLGIAPNKNFVSAGAQLRARVDTDTTVAAFTAGSMTIKVLFSVLA